MSYYSFGLDDYDYDYDLDPEGRDPALTALKNKYQSFDEQSSMSPKVEKRVEVLRELQGQYKELEKKFFEERAALVDKYHKLYEPLYTKRYEIVNGITEVEGVKNEHQEEDKANAEKGVPKFWLSALKNHKQLLIMKRDEHALKYLKDIKWCRIHNPKGFKLDFLFDPNPYFRNSVLTKTYHMIEHNQPIWRKEIGTEIEWYPGKNLTLNPRKVSKNAKPMTTTEICYSFFKFFKPPQYDDYIDEDMFDMFKTRIEDDHDMGFETKSSLLRYRSWFTGEAVKRDEFDDDDDEDDDDEEVEEEEEDDKYEKEDAADDNNEEEEDGKRKRSGRANAAGAQKGLFA